MKNKPLILIAEDDESMRFFLEEALADSGYDTISAKNGEEAVALFKSEPVDLVLLDIKMPKKNGLEVIDIIKGQDPEMAIVVLTAFATVRTAVEAMKKGVYDYITKPFDMDELKLIIEKALEKRRLVLENQILKDLLNQYRPQEEMVEVSAAMKSVYERVYKVASTDYTVLLEGESGTGKTYLARKIHELSPRSSAPFIRVNCAALPANLIESELFGFEKGAFTGATRFKPGKVEMANKGTLFLDEINTLNLSAQASLLHMIQEQEFERLGGTKTIKVDIRLIVASNEKLTDLVEKKLFREDLYFRLSVFGLEIPPLRDRKEDIMPLLSSILQRLSPDKKIYLSTEAASIIQEYSWPGNIRELENAVKHSLILLENGDQIFPCHLPAHMLKGLGNVQEKRGLKEILNDTERQVIKNALINSGNDIEKCARSLKIAKRSLYYRMSKLQITRSP